SAGSEKRSERFGLRASRMLNCVIRADQYINAQELLRFTFSLIKWEIVHKAKIQPGSAPGNLSIKRRIAMEGNDFESLLISAGSFCVFTFWRQRPTKDPRSVWSLPEILAP